MNCSISRHLKNTGNKFRIFTCFRAIFDETKFHIFIPRDVIWWNECRRLQDSFVQGTNGRRRLQESFVQGTNERRRLQNSFKKKIRDKKSLIINNKFITR
jgi:hypothetical protein